MKNGSRFLFLFAVLSLVLTACSKEKNIERQLIKKDGKWQITVVDYKYYVNNELQSSANFPSPGTIEFNKKGTFVMTLTLNGSAEKSGGTWTNTKDNITLIVDGEVTALTINEVPKKNKMKLTETNYDSSTGEKETLTYYLERSH